MSASFAPTVSDRDKIFPHDSGLFGDFWQRLANAVTNTGVSTLNLKLETTLSCVSMLYVFLYVNVGNTQK